MLELYVIGDHMKHKRVVVTGVGVVTPIGVELGKFWNNIISGTSGASIVDQFDVSEFDTKIACFVKEFDPSCFIGPKELKRMDKVVQFAIGAAMMAIEDSGLDLEEEDLDRLGVIVGTGAGGMQTVLKEYDLFKEKGPNRVSPFFVPGFIVNIASGQIAIQTGARGPNFSVSSACATSAHSIGEAARFIDYGDADIMLAGGSEAIITNLGLAGFCALKALSRRNHEPEKASRPFDRERDGFVMSEGAGVVVLESYEHASKRGAYIYGELAGYGLSCDAFHVTAPSPDCKGTVQCMKKALADAELEINEVGYINAHGTSTILNDKLETLAIKEVFKGQAKNIPISSTKSMTGHMIGAAGVIELIICALTIKNGIIPPTINYEYPDPNCDLDYVPNTARQKKVRIALSNSFGFGGQNATLIVKEI